MVTKKKQGGLKQFWDYLITDKTKKLVKTVKQKESIIKKNNLENSEVEIGLHESTGKRKLSNPVILFILINSILGSSLFFLPSLGVITSGAASIIAWIAVFVIATIMMLYIGELITLHPTSGGTYEFCKRAYGRTISFFAGWIIWIAGNFGMALAVVAAAEYFIPITYANYFVLRIVFALIWVLVLNYMAYRGIDAGATMLVIFGIIATMVVLAMTLPSFISFPNLFQGTFVMPFNLDFLQPFFQHDGLSIFSYLALSILLIAEAFFGFEVVSYMANEAEKPKELHKLIIKAMVICGVIMSIYVFSSLGTVSYHDYVTDARPFAVQALNTMGEFGQQWVIFGMYLVIIGTAAAWPITGSRLIRAMARDKLFIKHLSVLHRKHKSPYRAVYFQTVVVGIFSWLIFRGYLVHWGNPYRTIYLIYILLSMVVLSLVLLAVPILRKKEAHLERPFKAPFVKVVPVLFVIGIILLIWNWIRIEGGTAWSIINLAGSFIVLGIPFYFLVEMFYNPTAIVKVNEKLSFFVVISEKLFFPFSIRNKLLKSFGSLKNKTILEYGCSVGTLTKKMSQLVGPKGKIFATDLSLHKIRIADQRTKQIKHVFVHHHAHLDKFNLKLPQKVDQVISVGMLSYMQKPGVILKHLAERVKKNGEVVFLDYDKFFYLIPNVTWIENDLKLVKIFKQAGFSVQVERKNGLLWQYIIIRGKKK